MSQYLYALTILSLFFLPNPSATALPFEEQPSSFAVSSSVKWKKKLTDNRNMNVRSHHANSSHLLSSYPLLRVVIQASNLFLVSCSLENWWVFFFRSLTSIAWLSLASSCSISAVVKTLMLTSTCAIGKVLLSRSFLKVIFLRPFLTLASLTVLWAITTFWPNSSPWLVKYN